MSEEFCCGACGKSVPYSVGVFRGFGVWVCRSCADHQSRKTGPYHPECFRIAERLRAYYSSDEICEWMNAPHPQLNGDTAIARVNCGDAISVHEILDRLDADAYI